MPIKIVTAVVNNPMFIEIQYHTLKKYLKDGGGGGGVGGGGGGGGGGDGGGGGAAAQYEFIVFNDAKAFPDYTNDGDITLRAKIEETCHRLGIQCIALANEHHKLVLSAAERCADAMNAILQYQLQHSQEDKYLLLDSDMFLIADLDINKYSAYDCAVVLQSRSHNINYIWNGIYYFDMAKMKNKALLNWRQGMEDNTDVGGMMHNWLARQVAVLPSSEDLRWAAPEKTFHRDSVYFIKHLWSGSWNETELPDRLRKWGELVQFLKEDVRNVGGKFYCEIYDDVFLHYRAGGNWNKEGMGLHNALTEKLSCVLSYF
jgi:hypothetical protein